MFTNTVIEAQIYNQRYKIPMLSLFIINFLASTNLSMGLIVPMVVELNQLLTIQLIIMLCDVKKSSRIELYTLEALKKDQNNLKSPKYIST